MARILVVEDEPITAADLEQKLTALGHEIAGWSDTGEEAVAQAKEVGPDLVLMDIRLRGAMSGIEAAQALRDESDVPVVFLTAFADQDTVDRACKTEPHGYLLKPFSERSVATAVQVALGRARAERAQGERERWASAALQGTGEGLIAIDTDFAIRFVNEQAEVLLRAKAGDLLGKDARTQVRFGEAGDERTPHPLDAALHGGKVMSARERALTRGQGGGCVRVSYSAAPVLSARGETVGAVLVFREAKPQDASVGVERLQAVTKLSERLSHEINNPLTYNLGALHLALKELDTLRAMHALPGGVGETSLAEGEQHLVRIERLLRDAQEGATRVAGIMRELGAFTLSERDLATLDPTELLDLAIGFTAGPSLDHVRIMRRVDPAPLVRGSKWQLARVLAHGIQSVVEELDRAGIERCLLDLHVGTDARGWVEIRAHASAEAPADTGATSKRTGRPAPPSARATSVGVSVAEHILASHGGELLVCEEPGGRDFVLRLPPLDGPRARGEERGAKPGRRSRVLVIDDEPMIGRVLEISLQPECDVTFAESAREALPLLERGEGFDVILCDLTMPGMTGEQLYERLREQHPELVDRVIMMSGGATTREGSRFLASMEGRRIDKPFRVDELLPLIKARVQARAQAHAGSL